MEMDLFVTQDLILLKAVLAMAIRVLISSPHLPSWVTTLPRYLYLGGAVWATCRLGAESERRTFGHRTLIGIVELERCIMKLVLLKYDWLSEPNYQTGSLAPKIWNKLVSSDGKFKMEHPPNMVPWHMGIEYRVFKGAESISGVSFKVQSVLGQVRLDEVRLG